MPFVWWMALHAHPAPDGKCGELKDEGGQNEFCLQNHFVEPCGMDPRTPKYAENHLLFLKMKGWCHFYGPNGYCLCVG